MTQKATHETSRFLAALAGENDAAPPLWMMRQAGRTLASYRKLRKGHPFIDFCKNVDLAAEATLLPVRELGVDAAILFADILLPIEAFGLDLRFEEGIGPITTPAVESAADAIGLRQQPIEDHCGYVADIIKKLRQELPADVPLIGFCPSPWTLAAYVVEGQARKGFPALKRFLYSDPQGFSAFMDQLTTLLCDYAQMQLKAGIQAFQIFDTWAELLPPALLKELVLPRVQAIASSVSEVPVLYFPKGTAQALPVVQDLDVTGLSCDWTVDLAEVRKTVGTQLTLQGNLDPTVLYAAPDQIEAHTHAMLDTMAGDPAYIVNLGHGLSPDIPEDHVHAFVQSVKNWEPCS